MLHAVELFGNAGKSNKYIDLPIGRIYTKVSKSILNIFNILLNSSTSSFNSSSSEFVLKLFENSSPSSIGEWCS